MSSTFRQDMPPKGGYDSIEWARKMARKPMSGAKSIALVSALTIAGWTDFFLRHQPKTKARALEMNDGRLALEPFLMAEKERLFLRQLRKNRDDENETMKDIPGWKTGTLFGTPVYYSPANRWPAITYFDVYLHCDREVMERRLWEKHYH